MLQKKVSTGAFTKTKRGLEIRILLDLDVNHPKYKSFLELLRKVKETDKGLIVYSSGL